MSAFGTKVDQVKKDISLQSSLLALMKRLKDTIEETDALVVENEVLDEYVGNMLARVGAVKQLGTSPVSTLDRRKS